MFNKTSRMRLQNNPSQDSELQSVLCSVTVFSKLNGPECKATQFVSVTAQTRNNEPEEQSHTL